jgi:hypothetical protein
MHFSTPSAAVRRAGPSGLSRYAAWIGHAAIVGMCKLALMLAIMPAVVESAFNRGEGSEPVKAELECEFGAPVEHLRRSITVEHSFTGKILHPTHLVVVRFEQDSYSAAAHGHFLPNGLCAPRLC